MSSLTATAMRFAVVKSGLLRDRRNWPNVASVNSILRLDDGAVRQPP
jgi:hypothetical protein